MGQKWAEWPYVFVHVETMYFGASVNQWAFDHAASIIAGRF